MTCPHCHRSMHGTDESGRCTNPHCPHTIRGYGHTATATLEDPEPQAQAGSGGRRYVRKRTKTGGGE